MQVRTSQHAYNVINIPQKIQFDRGLNNYQTTIQFPSNESKISLNSLLFQLKDDKNGKLLFSKILETGKNTTKIKLPNSIDIQRVSSSINACVNYNEEIYGMHILHPDGPDKQGAKGLKDISIPISSNFSNSKILGFIGMPQLFYSLSAIFVGDNYDNNIQFWNYIFLAFLLILLIFILVRYINKNKTIKDHSKVIIKRNS